MLCFVLLYTWLIFVVVLFLQILLVSPRKNFHFNAWLWKHYSNENITNLTKLTHREYPHLIQNREIYGVYSMS